MAKRKTRPRTKTDPRGSFFWRGGEKLDSCSAVLALAARAPERAASAPGAEATIPKAADDREIPQHDAKGRQGVRPAGAAREVAASLANGPWKMSNTRCPIGGRLKSSNKLAGTTQVSRNGAATCSQNSGAPWRKSRGLVDLGASTVGGPREIHMGVEGDYHT